MSLSREDQRIIEFVMKAIDERKKTGDVDVTKKATARELGVSFRKALINETPIKVAARSPSSVTQQIENITVNLGMLESIIKELEAGLGPILREDDKLVGVLAATVDSGDAKYVHALSEINGRVIRTTATLRNLCERVQID